MIKLEKTEVVGWEHAIRGMRNAMNSWDKMDSQIVVDKSSMDPDSWRYECVSLGPNDYELMTKLRNAGTDHRKYMRMIVVYVDITAPLYWWKEFDTYKVGTVANSCSTMHKIHAKEFTLEDFSCERLMGPAMPGFKSLIDMLNVLRDFYNGYDELNEETKKNHTKKELWDSIIQLLPSSYNQKRTVLLNYEVLVNIYKSRKNHKLVEWHKFCDWIESLPYSEIITGEKKKQDEENG